MCKNWDIWLRLGQIIGHFMSLFLDEIAFLGNKILILKENLCKY